MPCFHPLTAFRTAQGDIFFHESAKHDIVQKLSLPCGQCTWCRLERSRQWAIRCVHEAQLYEENCFITLTYDEDHVPEDMSLNYKHFQDFMKRLRKHAKKPVRFYMCGEYGENLGRPHYHACLFGFDFRDKELVSKRQDFHVYRSNSLDSLWRFGFTGIGSVTFQSAAYIARYVMKKVTGDPADNHYSFVLPSGEIVQRTPEFNRMSLKPGVGAAWYSKYRSDVYPGDYVVQNGRTMKPPKYYDRLLQRENPEFYDDVKLEREIDAIALELDNTVERLAVKEQVLNAKLSQLKRHII